MARSYRPVIRDQEFLLPPNMADWLGPDHLVWFVIDVVEALDTSMFHRGRARSGPGRQAYDPDMLLTLLLYSYAVGQRSSRRIEQLCGDHVGFRIACGQDVPDHSTIARFRQVHQDAFAEVFGQVLRMCAQAGMVKLGTVAIDGTKIAADAARGANRTPDSVRKEARRIAEEILAQADATDAAEDAAEAARRNAGRGSGDDLPPGFAAHSGRAANIMNALAELDRQDAVHDLEDAADRAECEKRLAQVRAGQAISGALPAGIDLVAYHTARVERERERAADPARTSRQRIEARRVAKRAEVSLGKAIEADRAGQLDRRGARQRERERCEQERITRGSTARSVNITDPDSRLMKDARGGSLQGYNAQVAVSGDHVIIGCTVSQDGNDLNLLVPMMDTVVRAADGLDANLGTVLADAGYYTEENLAAPGPDRLIAFGKRRQLDEAAKAQDTGPPPAPPGPEASPAERMRHRLLSDQGRATYKRRGATVEPVIGHLKHHLGLDRFARRGLLAVTSELNLAAAVANIRRMHTLGHALS